MTVVIAVVLICISQIPNEYLTYAYDSTVCLWLLPEYFLDDVVFLYPI